MASWCSLGDRPPSSTRERGSPEDNVLFVSNSVTRIVLFALEAAPVILA